MKQAGLNWYNCVSEFFIFIGFHVCASDNCTFVRDQHSDSIVIIIIYVDDILVSARDLNLIVSIKDQIKRRFQVEDSGIIHYYLGITVQRNNTTGEYYMNQKSYIEELSKKFNVRSNSSIDTPLPFNFKYNIEESTRISPIESQYVDKFPIRQIIGAINYVAICTRPDISYAISLLARYQDKPNLSVCQAIIHLLKFLLNTKNYDLRFSGSHITLVGYSDSDWAGDSDSRKSTTGYILFIGNSPVNWQSKLQPLVTMSSTEAEYVALSTTAQENLCIKFLLKELGYSMIMPTTIYGDNQGAIQLTINHAQHKRTRHIDIKFHYVRDLETKGEIVISKIPTESMVADLLTKNTSKKVYHSLIQSLLGWNIIRPCEERIQVYERLLKDR